MKIITALILLTMLVGCDRDNAPKGEGSFEAGERMLNEIAEVKPGTVPPGYTQFDFADGSWIAARAIDSHNGPDGGTIGLVTNAGESGVFFTHVCGPGSTPLESIIFPADSAPKVLEKLRASTTEHKR